MIWLSCLVCLWLFLPWITLPSYALAEEILLFQPIFYKIELEEKIIIFFFILRRLKKISWFLFVWRWKCFITQRRNILKGTVEQHADMVLRVCFKQCWFIVVISVLVSDCCRAKNKHMYAHTCTSNCPVGQILIYGIV